MSRALPPRVRAVAEVLADTAGGYLRNTVRDPYSTCRTCSAPVDGYERCYQCLQHTRSGYPLADRVASMVYAIEPRHELDQMYKTMRGYKAPTPLAVHVQVVRSLLAIGLLGHSQCDLRLSQAADGLWATVPSTRSAQLEHPLHRLVRALGLPGQMEVTVAPTGRGPSRDLDPDGFATSPVPPNVHVTVIDDSWVTGGHAQSVAAALLRSGAGSVSILTVARVLNPDFGPNPGFIRRRLSKADFDPLMCPWTGTTCP